MKCSGKHGYCKNDARPGYKMCPECAAIRNQTSLKSYRHNREKVLARTRARDRKAKDYDRLAAELIETRAALVLVILAAQISEPPT